MQITIHGARLLETIKNLEGLPSSISPEEVLDRLPVFEPRLQRYLMDYGISGMQNIGQNGILNYYQLSFEPSHAPSHTQSRLDGVAVLQPNSVSIEYMDFNWMFSDPITKTAFEYASDDEIPKLQHITLPELRMALPEIQMRVSFGKLGPNNLSHIASFDDFLAAAGKKDPLAKFEAQEAARQREVDEYQAREEARLDEWYRRDGE